MFQKFVLAVVLFAVMLFATACNNDSQSKTPSCGTSYTPVANSISENNKNGLCKDAQGNLVDAAQTFSNPLQQAVKKVEQTATCIKSDYDKNGMGTSAVYGCTVSGTENFGSTPLYQSK